MSSSFRVPRRLTVIAAALVASSLLAACGDLTRPKAQASNFTDTLTVFTINGAPPSGQSGIWLFGNQGVVLSGSTFGFDYAFDIDSTGQLIMYTVRAVAGGLGTAHTVGLQRAITPFDSLLTAPKTGFANDSLLTVNTGDVITIVSTDPSACGFSTFSNQINAKVEVMSVDVPNRRIQSRFTVNPNCGFRSLIASGIPKD